MEEHARACVVTLPEKPSCAESDMPLQARRQAKQVDIDGIKLGGNAPVVVQSMTDTDTENAEATAKQVVELAEAGSEMVRITVNTAEAAAQVPEIKKRIHDAGIDVPLIGDFHFNGHLLLEKFPETARTLAKYRINPGNVGVGKRHDENFSRIIRIAAENEKPVRIGVNMGSLDQQLLTMMMNNNALSPNPKTARDVTLEAMIASALNSAHLAEELGLPSNRIVISVKMSVVQDMIEVYERLADRCDYPLHVGLTEAGMGTKGIVATTAALSVLLQKGIGDTIRVSLTPRPGAARTEEVKVAQSVLQALDIRSFRPQVTACPGCGRTTSTFFRELAETVESHLEASMPQWRRRYQGVESLLVAVMGCVVNGPGESKAANIGISLPGNNEDPKALVYYDGERVTSLQGDGIGERFIHMIDEYVESHYQSKDSSSLAPA